MGKTDKKSSLETNKCSSCNLDEFEKRVNPLIDNIKLSRYKRNILKKRYTKLVIYYENYANNIRWKYNTCRLVISVGSMILPTLQTIQNNENVAFIKDEIFWAAIATSLGVMISNNIISMFSLDRRYIMYAVTAEKLKAIGWKYFELSDMFSNRSHIENWILFWNEVEKIKKLQVIAEFTDNDDKQHEPAPITDTSKETDSEYDSDTPRSRTPRNTSHNSKYNEEFYEDDVYIDLEKERKNRIKNAQTSFQNKYNESELNEIQSVKNISNIVKEIPEKISETENVEIILEDLQNKIVENTKKIEENTDDIKNKKTD